MKANEVNLNRFLAQTDTQFVIPVYQRNYDWKKQQCRQLIDDILAVGANKKRYAHFIGSIVYIHDDVYSSSGIRELTIIDGQQRVTTITLIYLVLYVLAEESNNEALKQRINETYLINKFAREEEKLKLKPTENNDKALKYLLRSDTDEPYDEYSRLIENYHNHERVRIEDNPDITIEHIFPQNPAPRWKVELGESQYSLLKESYLNTIANLTLSGNNGPLSNKPFVEKRDMSTEGKDQGYRFSRLWLNKYLATCEKWGIEELETRFELIAERCKQIWEYPDIDVDNNGYVYNEVNIFEAEEPTHKKLAYAIFFDQKLELKHVSELYVHVIKTLFELQPSTFFTSDLGEKIGLTSEKERLRQASQIDETYYIEANLDNASKFERIKHALSAFELEDDLFIKYADE